MIEPRHKRALNSVGAFQSRRQRVDNLFVRALSIRQPYAEAILRGHKTIEYRSRPTRIIGEPFYIYASKGSAPVLPPSATRIWSSDLTVPTDAPAPWVLELATMLRLYPDQLWPTGVIVGTAVIEKVTPPAGDGDAAAGMFRWHLADVRRLPTPRKPDRHPQPAWFRPF